MARKQAPLTGLSLGLTKENAAERARRFIEDEIPKRPYPAAQFSGRGIVIAGGGTKYTPSAWVCLRALRHVGCTLPVQIWHLGAGEYNAAFAELCRGYGAEHVDGFAVRDLQPHGHLAGWELKPYAMTWCPWEEVLLLDADNMPVIDPTFMFDCAEYKQAGAVLWPDYRVTKKTNEEWQVFGRPYQPGHQAETGQVLLDKRRSWPALQLCNWYSERSPFYFRFVLGDTGTFYHSFPMTGCGVAMVPKLIHSLPGTMCQHAFDGRRLFQHRNFKKWVLEQNANDRRGDDFRMQDECFRWIAELAQEWSPAAQTLPTAADKEAVIRASQEWRYTRVGHDARNVTLRADGTFAKGGAACERFWTIRDGRLRIAHSDGRLTMDLESDGNWGWRGRWLIHEKMPITLRPIAG